MAWLNFSIVMAFDNSAHLSEAGQYYFDEIRDALRQPSPAGVDLTMRPRSGAETGDPDVD